MTDHQPDSSDATDAAPPDPLNAKLVEREDLTEELAIFRIAFEDDAVSDFTPGQFTSLGLPRPAEEIPEKLRRRRKKPLMTKRAYSIASSPNEKGFLEFYLVIVPEGKLTPRLWAMQQGDRLFMDPKIKGHFTLEDVPHGKDLVMVSTGTGLAPFVSMMRTYRHCGPNGENPWRKLVIIHGARLEEDLGYRKELEEISEVDESIVYVPCCTREPERSTWEGIRGRVHSALKAQTFKKAVGVDLTPESAHVFLCGNPAMIDQCEAELQERGFHVRNHDNPHGNIHFERYW